MSSELIASFASSRWNSAVKIVNEKQLSRGILQSRDRNIVAGISLYSGKKKLNKSSSVAHFLAVA